MLINPETLALATAFKSGIMLPDEVIYDTPDFLGSGCYGYAYNINDRVFKVTTSISESIYALKLKSLYKHNDHESQIANVYDVHLFENTGSMYFIIEQEKIEQDEDVINEIFSLLTELGMDYTFSIDDIEDGLAENSLELDDEKRFLISSLLDLYSEMTLSGFFNVDLHADNLGIKNGKICCFDQMDTEYEKVLEDDYLRNRDIFSILERNCPNEMLADLSQISSEDLQTTLSIEEINEFSDDLKFAFSTDEAYEYLKDGDWGSGGCYEYALVGLDMLKKFLVNEDINEKIHRPEIGKIVNRSTGNIEHYFVSCGKLCIDSDGLHHTEQYLNSFVSNWPHLSTSQLYIEKEHSKDLEHIHLPDNIESLKETILENMDFANDLAEKMIN